jgi:hypothetical protein
VTVIEQALIRVVPEVDHRSWLRWGAAVFAVVEAIHIVAGTLVNEWEGWGVFFGNVSFVVLSGAVITALVFGLLVRWGLKPSPRGRNRAAAASLAVALLSVVGYAAFFTWAHLLIAPAALLLARAGVRRAEEGHGGRTSAIAGALIGSASIAFGLVLFTYALFEGSYPFGL